MGEDDIMDKEVLKIYFKDLRVAVQRKIRAWFSSQDYIHYQDEDGERRHIDEMYNNVIPFFMFFATEDEDEDTSFMDQMVS